MSAIVYQGAGAGEAMHVVVSGITESVTGAWCSVRKVGDTGEAMRWDGSWVSGEIHIPLAACDTSELGHYSIVAYVTLASTEVVRTAPGEFWIAPSQP